MTDSSNSLVLSDVHIGVVEDNKKNCLSRFEFVLSFNNRSHSDIKDNDGDLECIRPQREVIYINHWCATKLEDVGTQVWNASLLMSNYILSNKDKFNNKSIIDLGCGVGLTSLICLLTKPKVIIASDYLQTSLDLCLENFNLNKQCLTNLVEIEDVEIKIIKLDWLLFNSIINIESEVGELLGKCQIIIASDVIYDNQLTEAFIDCVKWLLKFGLVDDIFISYERRPIFSIDDLDVSSPYTDHFETLLHELIENNIIDCKVINIDDIQLHFVNYIPNGEMRLLYLTRKM